MSNKEIEKKVFEALEDERYKWRTLTGVASQTGISTEEILQVLSENGDKIVKSSVPATNGDALFTTREHFHEMSSALEKIAGAFKGRIR